MRGYSELIEPREHSHIANPANAGVFPLPYSHRTQPTREPHIYGDIPMEEQCTK